MNNRDRITTALVALRIGVFIVMLMWTLDKFVNVTHASGVFEHFYGLRGFGPGIMAAIGVAELLLILAFVLGYQKRISYAGRALPSNRRRGHQRAATETTAQVERAILPIVPRLAATTTSILRIRTHPCEVSSRQARTSRRHTRASPRARRTRTDCRRSHDEREWAREYDQDGADDGVDNAEHESPTKAGTTPVSATPSRM
jgi:hypothetical protein